MRNTLALLFSMLACSCAEPVMDDWVEVGFEKAPVSSRGVSVLLYGSEARTRPVANVVERVRFSSEDGSEIAYTAKETPEQSYTGREEQLYEFVDSVSGMVRCEVVFQDWGVELKPRSSVTQDARLSYSISYSF